MRRIVCLLLALSVCSTLAESGTHESHFGFKIKIPANWMFISKEAMKKNPLKFSDNLYKTMDKSFVDQLRKVTKGDTEMIMRLGDGSGPAANIVRILIGNQPGKPPQTYSELDQMCKTLPEIMKRSWGKSAEVFKCEIRKVSGRKAFYLEMETPVPGIRGLQYMLPYSSSPPTALTIVCTCQNAILSVVRKELENMVASIRWR